MKTGNEFKVVYVHNSDGRRGRQTKRFGWTRDMASTQKFVNSQLHNPRVEDIEVFVRTTVELNPLAFIGVQKDVEIITEEEPDGT